MAVLSSRERKRRRRQVRETARELLAAQEAGADLRHLFPEIPLFIQDQLDAAVAQTGERLDQVGTVLNYNKRRAYPKGPLALAIWEFLLEGMAGLQEKCNHIGNMPLPMFASLWNRKLRCAKCAAEWIERQGLLLPERERFTCDLCRRYRPGDCRDAALQIGPLQLSYGICDACFVASGFEL